MKRFFCLFLALVMLLSCTACGRGGKYNGNYFATPEDISQEALLERTRTQTMLGYRGSFRADYQDEIAADGSQSPVSTSMRFAYDGENILANNMADYGDGTYRHLFFSTAHNDDKLYIDTHEGAQIGQITDREMQNILEQSLFSLELYESELEECSKNGDLFNVRFSCSQYGQLIQKVSANIDPESGMVQDAVIERYNGDMMVGAVNLTMTYGDVEIDQSPMEKALATVQPEEEQAPAEEANNTVTKTGSFTFATTDVYGDSVTYNDFADASKIMVHYWEPTDEASVSKLSDLQKLYEAHRIQDFVILGVFSAEGMDEEVKAIIEEAGVTFPILHMDTRLRTWQTDRVPSTIFVNENAELMTDEPFFGALSYEEWETVLDEKLTAAEEETEVELPE